MEEQPVMKNCNVSVTMPVDGREHEETVVDRIEQ